jgi:hypothetical protein
MKLLLLLTITLISFNLVAEDRQIELARNGKTEYSIVIGCHPTRAEEFAATELAKYLTISTGATYIVVNEKSATANAPAIYVGQTDKVRQSGIDYGKLGNEELIIKTNGRDIIITGGRPRGTLYGVYEFLKTQIGCAWLDPDTEYVPKHQDLKTGAINLSQTPIFIKREIHTGYTVNIKTTPIDDPVRRKYALYTVRNQGNAGDCGFYPELGFAEKTGSPGENHTFWQYINPKEYAATHPEYISMNAKGERESGYAYAPGSRVLEKDTAPTRGFQMCMTNPEVRAIVLAKLKSFIAFDREKALRENTPYPTIYDISHNDSHEQLCLCPNCKAIVEREGGAHSGLLLDFINQIAREIVKDYSDIQIMTFAYMTTLTPPKTITPEKNVIIRYCDPHNRSEIFRPLADPVNKEFYDQFMAWAKIAPKIAVWDYWRTFESAMQADHAVPYTTLPAIQPDLKLFAQNGVKILFIQNDIYNVHEKPPFSGEFQSFYWLKNYLTYQLMQQPDRDVNKIIQQYIEQYYGPAASSIKKYLEYLTKRQNSGNYSLTLSHSLSRHYLDAEFFNTVDKIFAEAEKAIGDNPEYKFRLNIERIPIDLARLHRWDNFGAGQDKEAILKRYFQTMTKYSERYYSANGAGNIQEKAKKDVEYFLHQTQRQPLPATLTKTPNLLDYVASDLQLHLKAVLKKDIDAADGNAAVIYEDENNFKGQSPLTFGSYNPQTKVISKQFIALPLKECPGDGKYHLYKLEDIPIPQVGYLYIHWSWALQMPRFCESFAEGQKNLADVYVEAKLLGPRYTGNNVEKNSIWISRIAVVKK